MQFVAFGKIRILPFCFRDGGRHRRRKGGGAVEFHGSGLSHCGGFAQQITPDELGPKIRNQHSPIANLEHPCAISLINNFAAQRIAKDSAEGCYKLAIGEC